MDGYLKRAIELLQGVFKEVNVEPVNDDVTKISASNGLPHSGIKRITESGVETEYRIELAALYDHKRCLYHREIVSAAPDSQYVRIDISAEVFEAYIRNLFL